MNFVLYPITTTLKILVRFGYHVENFNCNMTRKNNPKKLTYNLTEKVLKVKIFLHEKQIKVALIFPAIFYVPGAGLLFPLFPS